jgi:hypothetical protein
MKLRLGGKWWVYVTNRRLKVNDGLCDDTKHPRRILVSSELSEIDQLDTICHEFLHAVDPERMFNEDWVLKTGTEFANALWALGYRKEA